MCACTRICENKAEVEEWSKWKLETPRIVLYFFWSSPLWASEPCCEASWQTGRELVGGIHLKSEHDEQFLLVVFSKQHWKELVDLAWRRADVRVLSQKSQVGGKKISGSIEGGSYLLRIPPWEGNVETLGLLIVFR